ncbi:unnamed protein product, partial [Rotaria sordida]
MMGQRGKFDYDETQVIRVLSEENIYTVLISPTTSTNKTSKDYLNKVLFLPIGLKPVE